MKFFVDLSVTTTVEATNKLEASKKVDAIEAMIVEGVDGMDTTVEVYGITGQESKDVDKE